MVLSPSKHPNAFEHKENVITFLSYFLYYGFLGAFIGRSIDKSLSLLKKNNDSRLKLFGLFLLQILVNGIFFYITFKTIIIKSKTGELTIDDWISSTFQGLVFVTTLYGVQNNIYENIKNGLF
jgi:hypothetical protein